MTDERRFDESEVAEILERAASDDAAVPGRSPNAHGLTLTELQEIGTEVGIPAERIAAAASNLTHRPRSAAIRKTFLGAPRSVSRIVPIQRALNDDEWDRLVADLRATFGAVGSIRIDGQLRSWTNGNLQVHVEPDGDRHRVRMTTLKGDTVPLTLVGASFVATAVLFLLLALTEQAGGEVFAFAAAFGVAGLTQIGVVRGRLPGWADERASQMEGLAQRIPRLLEDPVRSPDGSHS